jgi:hypothetical protein
MVGQDAESGIQLKDVDEIATITVVAGISLDASILWIDCNGIKRVLDSGLAGCSGRKSNSDVVINIAQGIIAERQICSRTRDPKCPMIREVQQRRKLNLAGVIEEAKKRGMT